MKNKAEIKPYSISGLEKIDLFGINPNSESNCDFIIVTDLETEEPIISLKIESDYSANFKQCQAVNDLIVIGYGNRFVIYDLVNRCKKFETSFDGYFSSFKIDGNDIFVASESDLLKINMNGTLEWTAEALGIDGVVISKITESKIFGEGELDPPGGWESFVINRKTGN